MTTAHEAALEALEGVIEAAVIAPGIGAAFVRDPDSAVEATAKGVVVMSDGDPGDPEICIFGAAPIFLWSREVSFQVIASGADRTAVVDAIVDTFAPAIAADVSLGGAVDLAIIMKAPDVVEMPVPDAQTERNALVKVTLQYQSNSGAG